MQKVDVSKAYRELLDDFIDFSAGLAEADWKRPTLFPSWTVGDIYAHVASGAIRKLSDIRKKERSRVGQAIGMDFDTLVSFINADNERWVETLRPLDMSLVIDMLGRYYGELIDALESMDPDAEAVHQVAWAHDSVSPAWLDTAREYTELWTHQMQIREVFGDASPLEPRFYRPFLETCLAALPTHFGRLREPDDFGLLLRVGDDMAWFITRKDGIVSWREAAIADSAVTEPSVVDIRREDAWKAWMRAIDPKEAARRATLGGDRRPGLHLLGMKCVMML